MAFFLIKKKFKKFKKKKKISKDLFFVVYSLHMVNMYVQFHSRVKSHENHCPIIKLAKLIFDITQYRCAWDIHITALSPHTMLSQILSPLGNCIRCIQPNHPPHFS